MQMWQDRVNRGGVVLQKRIVVRGSMNVHQRVHDRGKKEHNRGLW